MFYGFWRTASKSCSLHCVKKQDIVTTIAFACCCLYNVIQIRYSVDPEVESYYPTQKYIIHYKSCLTTFCYDVLNSIFDLFFRTLQIVQVKKRVCCTFAQK